jgi:peptidoglycan/LPS O-acetylase OafA/YrhL
VITILIVAAPVFRWATPGLGSYVGPQCRADSVLMGAVCAGLVRQPIWRGFVENLEQSRWVSVWLNRGLVCAGIAVVIAMAKSTKIGAVVNHFTLAVFFASTLLWAIANGGANRTRWLRHPVFGWLSFRSFGIFLLHQPVAGLLHAATYGRAPAMIDAASFGVTVASLITTLLLADLSWRWLERPMLAWDWRSKLGALPAR